MSLTLGSSVSASAVERLDTLPQGIPEHHGIRTLGYYAWAFTQGLTWNTTRSDWDRRWYGLVQPNGPRAGKRFLPTTRQLRFWLWFYAVNDDGGWLFDHAQRRLSKGAGKSPSAAVTSLVEFCGDVRLDRFDDRAEGGCLGRPVPMPWVQIAATAESQTKNTMRMVRAFAGKGSPIVEEFNLDPGKTMYYKMPEGQLEVITSSATAAEGAETTFLVQDETEHWLPNNGGNELSAVLSDNLAKSGARAIETCNAWVPGRGSVAEATWDAFVAQDEGRTRGEGRILCDTLKAPAGTDMADPDSLRSALQFVYGDCDWKRPHDDDGKPLRGEPVDVEPIVRKIYDPRTDPNDARRKYLNWPSVASDAWVDPREWDRLVDRDRTVSPREPVVLFFDGSRSRDATALVGCTVDDGHVFTLGVWEPNQNDPADTVDFADVDRVLDHTMQSYNVQAFFADVREWESFALTEWPNRYREQLDVWAAPSARPPQPIAWDMRGHSYEFAKAAEATHAEIVEGSFTHDGNPVTGRHVGNCRRRPYRDAVSVGKAAPGSPRKIDAAVCVIGARLVRRMVLGAASKRRRRTGVVV